MRTRTIQLGQEAMEVFPRSRSTYPSLENESIRSEMTGAD